MDSLSKTEKAILIKSLKSTDINIRLAIPHESLKCFHPLSGKNMVDFQVRDEGGHIWKFRLYTRNRNNKYPKPVLTKGWREFVCSKGLRIGDRVAIYLDKEKEKEKDGAVKYRIQVEKQVKIFGAVFRHNPL